MDLHIAMVVCRRVNFLTHHRRSAMEHYQVGLTDMDMSHIEGFSLISWYALAQAVRYFVKIFFTFYVKDNRMKIQ